MKRRPWVVTFISLLVLTFSIVQLAGLRAWFRLSELELAIPGWYLPGRSLALGAAGLVGAVGLFVGKTWSARYLRVLTGVYLVWFWVDRLFIRISPIARPALPFYGSLVSLGTLLLLWLLGWERVKAYVEEFVA